MKLLKRLPLFLLAILLLLPFGPARADAAPPMNPPGGNVSPEGGTEVQMAAEQVIIDFRQSTDDSANVTAWFLFHNTGTDDEKLKVRFPLNGDAQGNKAENSIPLIDNFTAWIGGHQLATHTIKDEDPNAVQYFLGNGTVIYWAVFEVDFPAGNDVKLTVEYTLHPTEQASFAFVNYLLATGAGWKGPIEKADIIFRFPYILNEYNLPDDYTTANNQPEIIRENEVWIHWDNLEPTDRDNVSVTIIQPHLWQEVLRWRTQVISSPDDAKAWLELARAYAAAGREKHGMFINNQFSLAYIQAFERTLTLDTNDASLHVEFANGLLGTYFMTDNANAIFLNEIATALKLDPNNADALSLLQMMQLDPADLPTPGPFPTYAPPTPTLEPAATATRFIVTVTPSPTPQLTKIPILEPTLVISLTSSPAFSSDLENGRNSSTLWLVLLSLVLLAGAGYVNWRSVRKKKD